MNGQPRQPSSGRWTLSRKSRPLVARSRSPVRLAESGAVAMASSACEADSFRALVAALLDDPNYERADVETRLVARLRIADDVRLLGQMQGRIVVTGDRDGENVVNVASDEPFIRSLDRLGVVSLAPNFAGEASG